MYCQSIKGVAYGKTRFRANTLDMILIFTYQVPEGSDLNLTGYTGVCKIRKRPNEAVIFELNATVEEKSVTFSLAGDVSAKKQLQTKDFVYDAFIYNESDHIKLGYGKLHYSRHFNALIRGDINHGR